MLNLQQIQRLLHDRRLDIVSKATGVHTRTLARLRDGDSINPTLRTIMALSDYFEGGLKNE